MSVNIDAPRTRLLKESPTVEPHKVLMPFPSATHTFLHFVGTQFRRIVMGAAGRAKNLLRFIIFELLSFRACYTFAVLFRHFSKRKLFDNDFVLLRGPEIAYNLDWVLNSWISKKCVDEAFIYEVFIYLFLSEHWSEARTIFYRLSQGHQEHIIGSAEFYSLLFLPVIHATDWYSIAGTSKEVSKLLRPMLEQRSFEYEEYVFRRRADLDAHPDRSNLELYITNFFRDKKLIYDLLSDLELTGQQRKTDPSDALQGYWKESPAERSHRDVSRDISLVYAYRHLIYCFYHNGEGWRVPTLYRCSIQTQKRLRRSLPVPSAGLKRLLDKIGAELPDISLLSPDWSALIGHNGHLNVHLMMRTMGWWRGTPILLAYSDRIANRPFLSLFNELCPILTLGENVTPEAWHELASLTPFVGTSFQAFAFEDGRTMYWNDAGAMALNQWESESRGFPLREIYDRRLQADDRPDTTFASVRLQWGMKPGDWYVCLHMRDAKARSQEEGTGESIRNTSTENYLDAIRYITELGGWVIRMGGPEAPPLPNMPRLIDYARSRERQPLLDIHLVRKARMFIGTTSGFAYVASSFGIPTAMVNAISSVGLLWSKDTRFALKPIYTLDGRMLSFRDVTSEKYRWAFPTHEAADQAGIKVLENSSDEILETVKEVFGICLAGDSVVADSGRDNWMNYLSIPTFFGSASPSKYFLEKYEAQLLGDP